jgi:hypothetical protein
MEQTQTASEALLRLEEPFASKEVKWTVKANFKRRPKGPSRNQATVHVEDNCMRVATVSFVDLSDFEDLMQATPSLFPLVLAILAAEVRRTNCNCLHRDPDEFRSRSPRRSGPTLSRATSHQVEGGLGTVIN